MKLSAFLYLAYIINDYFDKLWRKSFSDAVVHPGYNDKLRVYNVGRKVFGVCYINKYIVGTMDNHGRHTNTFKVVMSV